MSGIVCQTWLYQQIILTHLKIDWTLTDCGRLLQSQEIIYNGNYAQFELPGKFMKVSYNDSLSDKSM